MRHEKKESTSQVIEFAGEDVEVKAVAFRPVEPLLVGQPHAFAACPCAHVAPIFPSLPFMRRARFERCLIHSSTVRSAITTAPGRSPSIQSATGLTALAMRPDNEE